MKTKKNNTKKEQIIAQVENPEIVAAATEVTNPEVKDKKKDKKSKKKAMVEELPATKTKKKKDKVVKEVSKKQEASIMEEVVAHRDVKYLYPADITDTLARKKWRQEVRNKYRALEREMNRFIQDQTSKDFKKAKKAFETYRDSVLKPGMAI